MNFIFLSNTVPPLLTSKQLSLYLLKSANMHGVCAMLILHQAFYLSHVVTPEEEDMLILCGREEYHACVYMASILLLTCCFVKIPSLCVCFIWKLFVLLATYILYNVYTLNVIIVTYLHNYLHSFIPVFFSCFQTQYLHLQLHGLWPHVLEELEQ